MCCLIQHTCRFCLPGFGARHRKIQLTVSHPAQTTRLRYYYAKCCFYSCCCPNRAALTCGSSPRHSGLADEFAKVKSDYADVFALEGTAKGEILAIAKILRAKPGIAVDQTAASGEYCFNSGLGTMVHFATMPENTAEDVVYEFDASGLIAAGLDRRDCSSCLNEAE